MISPQGFAYPVGFLSDLPILDFFRTFSRFFRILGAAWAQRESAWHFFSFIFDFLSILDGFGEDLGRVLEGFFDGFSIVS